MNLIEVNSNNFDIEVEKSNEFILLDFYGTYCTPCKQLEQELKHLSLENIKICKINIDNELNLAIKYGIMSVPSLVLLKENKVLNKINGFITKDELIKKLNKFI